MLCDGRIVCGCADPYAKRQLGDCRTHTLADVWKDSTIQALRNDLNAGGSAFCGDCPLKLPLEDGEDPPQQSLDVPPLPSRLFIECTAACNISCFKACCAPETGITRTREAGMLDFDLFTRRDRRGRTFTGTRRLLQLRRGVLAQTRSRDVPVHQVPLPAHLPVHEHQRGSPSTKRRRGSSSTRASTR